MARIPEQIIEQVREAHDIVDVVGRVVQLKKAGAGYKGLCPFHEEKTPSFTVHAGRQTFKCFGCGKGGNVFGFLTETQGLSFPEAVRRLAEERGIRMPEDLPPDPERDERLEAVRQALSFAHRFFVEQLSSPEGEEARAYLLRRGYDEASVSRFGLGYAPAAWDRLVTAAGKAGVSARALEEAGLAIPRREGEGVYDRFRHRIIFPIADPRSRLATFAGRTLDPEENAKYINGPETTVFKKANVLYMLHRARDSIRRKEEALLMEGYTDVLMCHLNGFEHAVAGMGTAFTEQQARLLSRAAERVVLLYDGDAAGQTAAERAIEVLLEQGLEVRIALLPEGRDVDEILLEEGPEALDAILAAAQDPFEFKLAALAGRHDLKSPRGRAKASEALITLANHVKSPIERDQLLHLIAERLGGGEAVLRREAALQLSRARPGRPTRAAPQQPGPADSSTDLDGEPEGPPLTPLERALKLARGSARERDEIDVLGALLAEPGLQDPVFRAVDPADFTAAARERLYNALHLRWEQGQPLDLQQVMALFQSDPEVTAVLAGLPEDPDLGERVTCQLEFMERRRSQDEHQRQIVQKARGGNSASDATSDPDPDGSYYDDDVVLGSEPQSGGASGTEAF